MRIKRMGWRPDLSDHRDYGPAHPKLPAGFVRGMMAPLHQVGADAVEVDLRPQVARWLDQQDLGSCTAHGGIGLLEFFTKKTYGTFTPLSRRFLYKATRDFMGVAGDTGAEIRNMMGAIALFGVPPEDYDPYDIARFDDEPAAFHYALAANYKGTQYARLDRPGLTREQVLEQLKGALLKGWPFVFGFTCFSSLDDVGTDGAIPFPTDKEKVTGGHCMYVTGFSDLYQCKNATPGAFSGVNSWGRGWGDHGSFWMPYDYVLRGLLVDCWTLTRADWIDPEPFR